MMRPGVLVIDKPAGLSSAQVVSRVKRSLNLSKIGHAGTLDPLATGLLVCLVGSATRLASYAEGGSKTYSGTFKFGITTETDDVEGEVIEEREVRISAQLLAEHTAQFKGSLQQLPPRISAIKIDGVPAYERVRANQTIDLAKRAVVIDEFSVEFLPPNRARYLVRCSKGTYIRSIARDLGEALGCGGVVETLRRERSEPFGVDQSCTLEEVTADAMLPWEVLFAGAPRLNLGAAELRSLAGGDQRCLSDPRLMLAARRLLDGAPSTGNLLYGLPDEELSQGILRFEGTRLVLALHLRD